jgi:hypothetical protein
MAWSASGSLRFFMAQAVGIVIEDFVGWVWRLTSGSRKGGGEGGKGKVEVWKKAAGFVWVVVFVLFWSSPAWVFPNAIGNTGMIEGKMLPFSVVGFFVERFT